MNRPGLRPLFRLALPSLVALTLAVSAAPAAAQQKLLTLDDLYDPSNKVDFNGRSYAGLAWLDDAHYLQPSDPQTRRSGLHKIDAVTGRSEPFFDAARMQAALETLPGVTADEARRQSNLTSYTMNATSTAVVLSIGTDLYHYQFGADRATRLTFSIEEEEEVAFSPDGTMVSFVREHDLFVIDLAAGREVPLTTDGSEDLLNGKLDWLYQEEIYGRGNFRGYWWSPDSARIAFLQLNEQPVPEFIVQDHIPYRPKVERWNYPKAGIRIRSRSSESSGPSADHSCGWTRIDTPAPKP